jgi:AcrR family transcriptional regulator
VDAISIDELVSAAGVAKGSFFNHFDEKAAYAAAIVAAIRCEFKHALASAKADISDPLARLSGGMRTRPATTHHVPATDPLWGDSVRPWRSCCGSQATRPAATSCTVHRPQYPQRQNRLVGVSVLLRSPSLVLA